MTNSDPKLSVGQTASVQNSRTLIQNATIKNGNETDMEATVGIVDYQMGNLRSVQKAIERVGGSAFISGDRKELAGATHLILPGVGAFGDAMTELHHRGLVGFLQEWSATEKPFLGICLGMQLLFESSDEGGRHEGLGMLPGTVVRFENNPLDRTFKVPHMGWNQVASTLPDDTMLAGISGSPHVYFVHSYFVRPSDPNLMWLTADYGATFCAAVRRRNLLATQFHPEKSQRDGLQLLANFLKLQSH